MNVLKLMANPAVRKAMPILAELSAIFNVDEGSSSPELLDTIDKVAFLPKTLGFLRNTSVADFDNERASQFFATMGVSLSASDVGLWVDEIETFASGGEQSMLHFLFGPQGRAMLTSVLTRDKAGPVNSDLPIPTFDASSGVFLFE